MPKHFDAMHLLGVVALQTGRLDDAHALISERDRPQPEVRRRAEQPRQRLPAPGSPRRSAGLLRARGEAAARIRRRPLQPRQPAAAARPTAGRRRRTSAAPPRPTANRCRRTRTSARRCSTWGRARRRARAGDRGQAEARPCRSTGQSRHRARPTPASSRARSKCSTARRSSIPKSTLVLRNRGTVLARLGRHAEARQCLESVLALEPASAAAHCNLGNVLRDSGAPAEALEHFRRAVELDPGLVEARIGLALALRDLGRDDEAREQGRQLLQDQPNSAAALHLRGRAMPGARRHQGCGGGLPRGDRACRLRMPTRTTSSATC